MIRPWKINVRSSCYLLMFIAIPILTALFAVLDTMSLKTTPLKDVETTTKLSVKSGYLMKKDKAGQWKERFVCTVPHTFLYYYDTDDPRGSTDPRGVIDMEVKDKLIPI